MSREFQFAGIALNHSSMWELPEDSTLRDTLKFTVGLICLGEATHCCEISASTYMIDLENYFVNPDGSPLTDEQIREQDRTGVQYEGLDHGYIRFVDPDTIASNPNVSEPFTVEIDEEDYADEEDPEEAIRKAAWDEAEEYARCNGAAIEPPIIGDPSLK